MTLKSLAIDSNVLFTNIVKCIFVLLPVGRFCCVDINIIWDRTKLKHGKIQFTAFHVFS